MKDGTRPDDMREALEKSLKPSVQALNAAFSRAQEVYAEDMKSEAKTAYDALNLAKEDYESAVVHVRPHCKQPKAADAKASCKAKARGKAKATKA